MSRLQAAKERESLERAAAGALEARAAAGPVGSFADSSPTVPMEVEASNCCPKARAKVQGLSSFFGGFPPASRW